MADLEFIHTDGKVRAHTGSGPKGSVVLRVTVTKRAERSSFLQEYVVQRGSLERCIIALAAKTPLCRNIIAKLRELKP
jgi:hypothetical protein